MQKYGVEGVGVVGRWGGDLTEAAKLTLLNLSLVNFENITVHNNSNASQTKQPSFFGNLRNFAQ